MATVVSASGTNQTLALTKADCGKIADFLERGGCIQLNVNPAIINVLQAIVASADTTNLSTN